MTNEQLRVSKFHRAFQVMRTSQKLMRHLEETKNWRFRTKVKQLIESIYDDSRYLDSRVHAGNMNEVDVITRRIHAQVKVLDSLLTKKKKELQ